MTALLLEFPDFGAVGVPFAPSLWGRMLGPGSLRVHTPVSPLPFRFAGLESGH